MTHRQWVISFIKTHIHRHTRTHTRALSPPQPSLLLSFSPPCALSLSPLFFCKTWNKKNNNDVRCFFFFLFFFSLPSSLSLSHVPSTLISPTLPPELATLVTCGQYVPSFLPVYWKMDHCLTRFSPFYVILNWFGSKWVRFFIILCMWFPNSATGSTGGTWASSGIYFFWFCLCFIAI